jgi:hypothetical protein
MDRTTNCPFIAKKNARLLPKIQRNWRFSSERIPDRHPLFGAENGRSVAVDPIDPACRIGVIYHKS